MRIPIIDIGNSKGIRIPQAVLKQAVFGDEVDLEVVEGKITLRKSVDPDFVPDFAQFSKLDDPSIQRILRKTTGPDLLTALIGAEAGIKDAFYRNLSPRVRRYLEPTVERLERGGAKDLLIERSRSALCEAMLDLLRE